MRRATTDDVKRMLEMGEAMHAESRYGQFKLNLDKAERFFRHIIENESFIVLVDGDPVCAMFIGYVNSFWWGDTMESNDLLLYVAPDKRGGLSAARMVRAYTKIAASLGVQDIKIGASTGVEQERTLKFYERMGFKPFAENCTLAQSPTVH